MTRVRGFTLAELAIVLTIMAILGVSVLTAWTSRLAASRINATRENALAIKTALQNFIAYLVIT